MKSRILYLALIVLLFPVNGFAVNPDEVLDDPVLEERAREISKGLRCLVCQNQSIDDSDAGLAKDLRILVRERLVAGDSDEGVVNYVVSRYGEFVLLKPRFKTATLALWLGPLFLVLMGLIAIGLFFRRTRNEIGKTGPAFTPLSDTEQRRLSDILKGREA